MAVVSLEGPSVRSWRFEARWLRPAIGPALLLVLWYAAYASGAVNAKLIPSPVATLASLGAGLADGSLLLDFWHTLARTAYAFALGAVFGIPVGIALGANAAVYRSIEFLIDFFRSTPATAMFPLFMLIFGLGDLAKIAVAGFAAWLVIVFNVAYGVMNARKTRILAARIMGASRVRLLGDVMFFEALPQTFVGLRTAVSLALVVIVVAEMFIGATDGLGHRIIDAQITFDLKRMYATILLSGILGYSLNLAFLVAEARLVHWAGR